MTAEPTLKFELTKGDFLITDDQERLDVDAVVSLIRSCYWAPKRPREAIEVSLRNSLSYGIYDRRAKRQIGIFRVVTDYVTFAWLCDVIIEEAYRHKGIGHWALGAVLEAPKTKAVTRWILATLDAHALYAEYGFSPLAKPELWMERVKQADCASAD